ncbi:Alpha/Beta hydrolase protein [Kockovaella imperatae]|uniref:Carboxylic ester hydrolase n=1 Tax=Kockovaella imperatae TaxID=4999 RepID=A0A1Y1U8V5_9TREE|nr:Alpha/Beta hydrolase protein [Kockovaella imperatae]ORX34448.1 Alpha/Beta hydrolase protein [Kockovaella imperatae]
MFVNPSALYEMWSVVLVLVLQIFSIGTRGITSTTENSAGQQKVTFHPCDTNGQSVDVYGYPNPGNISIFYGIPFAQPPLGPLRFKPPQKPMSYPSVIDVPGYKRGCMQGPIFGHSNYSEDCLYLNVWRPDGYDETSKLPVLVWLYGGGYLLGSAQAFNFTQIMEAGIAQGTPFIAVNGNYRLGPFGFGYGKEYLEDGSSNSGLWDVVAVLDWVDENIASFGGDPDHVTLAGQSAGAVSASLMALVKTPPKVVGIIMNDGAPAALPLAPTTQGYPELYPLLLNLTNCSDASNTFECLRYIDADILNNASLAIRATANFTEAFPWTPNVDYDLLPDRPSTLLREGRFLKVPMLFGDNYDEGTSFVLTDTNSTEAVIAQVNYFEPVRPDNATMTRLLELYPNIPALGSPYGTGNDTFGLDPEYKRVASIVGDITFQHARRDMLEQMNANGYHETWTWLWDAFAIGFAGGYHGVPHTWDTAWWLGQVDPGYPETALDLEKQTLQYWLNFIINSDPNEGGSTNYTYWPRYRENGEQANMFKFVGNASMYEAQVIQDDYRKEQIAFINDHPLQFNA